MFKLDTVLQRDCFVLGHFDLCQLLLMNDKNYPWFILVPRINHIQELFQLSDNDQQQLIGESSSFSKTIHRLFAADKLNIAALGNVVPQLHIHHIVRYKKDPAWPAPVWGTVPAAPYEEDEKRQLITKLKPHLTENFSWL